MSEKEGIQAIETAAGRRLAIVKEPAATAGSRGTKCYELINAKRIKAYKFDTRTLVDLDSIDAMYAALPEM